MNSLSLKKVLELETIYKGLYRGIPYEIGSHNVFGGHVLGQALLAARKTVSDDRHLHSMHSYFILPGNKDLPLFFHVDEIRDGGSFNTRRVVCSQNGKDIFIMSASYQKHEEGLQHQKDAPEVKGPEDMVKIDDLKKVIRESQPESMRKYLNDEWPIDVRIGLEDLPIKGVSKSPTRKVWMKLKHEEEYAPEFHKCMLAYASDFNLLTTALMPHGIMIPSKGLMLASLDHAMWFHHDFNFNDWLLYEVESPRTINGRGLCFGHVYDKNGIMVASVSQEGLVRYDSDRK
jgi:acyl-CoA thioesterase-2